MGRARDSVGMDQKREIQISARCVEVNDALREKVVEIARKLRGYGGAIGEIRFLLDREPRAAARGGEFVAKGDVEGGGERFLATAEGEDPQAALGELVQKLDRLIRRRLALETDSLQP